MSQIIKSHFISVFVYHAIFRTMTRHLATKSALSLHDTFNRVAKGELPASAYCALALPLVSVLGGLTYFHLQQPISDHESFEAVMDHIFSAQFIGEEMPWVRDEALVFLEFAMESARQEGLAALEEALSGFPASGGDLANWEWHRLDQPV